MGRDQKGLDSREGYRNQSWDVWGWIPDDWSNNPDDKIVTDPKTGQKTTEKALKEEEAKREAFKNSEASQIAKKKQIKAAPEKLPGDLRYPYAPIQKGHDYINFGIFRYKRPKGSLVTRSTIGEDGMTDVEGSQTLKADPLGNILLPMPREIKDSNKVNYGQDGSMNFLQEMGLSAAQSVTKEGDVEGAIDTVKRGFKSAIGSEGFSNMENGGDLIANRLAMSAVNAFGGNMTFAQVMQRSEGAILNPNQELLFSGPSLRNFSFAFQFVPRHQKEAQVVRTIIKAFKRNMTPKGGGGNFLKTPNIFEITYEGDAKKYLNRIKVCALTNVATDYSAGLTSWSTYEDGAPVSMSLALSFTELLPIFNEDYKGYDIHTDGVGY